MEGWLLEKPGKVSGARTTEKRRQGVYFFDCDFLVHRIRRRLGLSRELWIENFGGLHTPITRGPARIVFRAKRDDTTRHETTRGEARRDGTKRDELSRNGGSWPVGEPVRHQALPEDAVFAALIASQEQDEEEA